ncbi:MAG TPA: glycosyltransferase [Noviherbaspirillum sp.]|uniref:glycosyltransferase n=1 Tax=Noviherbaspirillum sp. TaxID=1926288 RepID=UPI002B47AEDE|nr:glycosyltransferase [Noviherbaspirillum sp.]HJV84299.1 glycosyltransferase [Noviherbaspirillum sp.]
MTKTANHHSLAGRLKCFISNIIRINRLREQSDAHEAQLEWLRTVAQASQPRLDALEGITNTDRDRIETLEATAREAQQLAASLQQRLDALEAIAASERLERLETSVTPAIQRVIAGEVHGQVRNFQKRLDQERLFNPLPVQRPRLAYLSPLPPERSGISDYSAELLPELARYYEIEVIVAQAEVADHWVQAYCPVRSVEWFEEHLDDYARVLYQFGNSPYHSHMFGLLRRHPGVVVLHDFFLSSVLAYEESTGAMPGAWTQALYHSHGYMAVRDSFGANGIEYARNTYPSNLEVLERARGVIVHSGHARELACHWYGEHAADDWRLVPHLRVPVGSVDRAGSRQALGIDENDFVVCSFGFIDPVKLSHRLLDAWLGSALKDDPRCRLVFVGANHPGEYGDRIAERIRNSGCQDRIRITGWADDAVYKQYLQAADAGVQLRGVSRGETSGSVLHCMNHGLPTIVNENGSMAELPPDAVWRIPEAFSDGELISALECLRTDDARRGQLGAAAKEFIRMHHDPAVCAKLYADAIEAAYHAPVHHMPSPRQLLVDVSTIARNDLQTGIERVVRAQLSALFDKPPAGLRVEPVYLSDEGGAWHYRYARAYTKKLLGIENAMLEDAVVEVSAGDVLYSPDFCPFAVVEAARSGLYADWRARGVEVNFLIHDVLPVLRPEFFPEHADQLHAQWLTTIAGQADRLLCISRAVANETRDWLRQHSRIDADRLDIAVLHHGANISASFPSTGMPDDANQVLADIAQTPSFLMVGTIEPRKGHLQALAAVERLWQDGRQVKLVIVGKEGWTALPDSQRRTIPHIVERLRHHPELGKRLLWLQDVSDEYLQKLYAACTCLLFASEGEGFGLPLIEASRHNLPIIVRDLPVFREVAQQHAYYFKGLEADELASAISVWLALHAEGRAPSSSGMPWRTWAENVAQLESILATRPHRHAGPVSAAFSTAPSDASLT